jgi:hypothetical protein
MEAAAFSALGVNLFAARLVVALSVAACVVVLYRLVLATHDSVVLAVSCTVAFVSLRPCQTVSTDVMLEFPTLAFMLAAMWQIRDVENTFSWRRAMAFALFAGAAVWTKQNAVFLGVLPFAMAILTRQWRLLRHPATWVSATVFAALCAALTKFCATPASSSEVAMHPGLTTEFPTRSTSVFFDVAVRNAMSYVSGMDQHLGTPLLAVVAAAIVVFSIEALRNRPGHAKNTLYVAWTAAALALTLVAWQINNRYLLFAYPPMVVIGLVALYRLSARLFAPRIAWGVPSAVAAVMALSTAGSPGNYLYGPAEAASVIRDPAASRVVYCGHTDGAFIFSARAAEPDGAAGPAILRGDKLPASTFNPAEFEDFAHRYGIGYVILERTANRRPWDALRASPSASMVLVRTIRQSASTAVVPSGELYVYRFTNPASDPESTLTIPVGKLRSAIELKL